MGVYRYRYMGIWGEKDLMECNGVNHTKNKLLCDKNCSCLYVYIFVLTYVYMWYILLD